MSVWGCKIY